MRGHSAKSEADRVHDEVIELLDDMAKFIAPLMPEGYKWSLFIDPGESELKYWSGNVTGEEYRKLLLARFEKDMQGASPTLDAWFKAGPPRETP